MPRIGTAPEDRLTSKVGPQGRRGRSPVDATTRKKIDRVAQPSTLMISVERRQGRSLTVSIRGSTIGVLLALVLLAAAAWLMLQ